MVVNAGIDDKSGAVVVEGGSGDDMIEFPFHLSDLAYWVVRRGDGVLVKHVLIDPAASTTVLSNGDKVVVNAYPHSGPRPGTSTTALVTTRKKPTPTISNWCSHTPAGLPIFQEGTLKLWVADAVGLRATRDKWDHILDCGEVLPIQHTTPATLTGNADLVKQFSPYVLEGYQVPSLLKVLWADRQAPPLAYEFFKEYAMTISGNCVTACQGGHGRSGTSAVCIMMARIPDYTPFAAICHLRALHCPRAIESVVQHEFIGEFGAYLGRENDIAKVGEVKSFKESFLGLKIKGAKKYQEALESGKVASKLDKPEYEFVEWGE